MLQHRADWVHHGGTWSVPGGAIHCGESPWDAALLGDVAFGEQQDLVWLDPLVVNGLPLHPGFGDSWPVVPGLLAP